MATVLIIEDEANIRMFITANLEVRGYSVLQAATGTVGLNHLQNSLPDVIVLDMLLPDMQGWDILDVMAKDDSLNTIPVILMSASVNAAPPGNKVYPNLVMRLVKPSSVQVLIDAVHKAIQPRMNQWSE